MTAPLEKPTRCNRKCWSALHEKCTCGCGGKNHGVKLAQLELFGEQKTINVKDKTDEILFRLDNIVELIDREFTEIENLLYDVNPHWREDAEAENRQKISVKVVNDNAQKADLPDDEVMEILRSAWCEGNHLKLPPGKLKRDLYNRVNDVLLRLGGKWVGGKIQAHVFDESPAPLLAKVLSGGDIPAKNPLSFYWTPEKTIDRIIATIDISPRKILEPSAGDGAIVKRLLTAYPEAEITAIEFERKRAAKLLHISERVNVIEGDFLNHRDLYDCVIMNPPFAIERDKLEYIAHIRHAYNLLLPDGLLRSIAPQSILYRGDNRVTSFREAILKNNGFIEKLDDGSFYESGTSIKTVLVGMTKGNLD